MSARTRRVLAVVAVLWIAALGWAWPHLSPAGELLLVTLIVPVQYLLWVLCRASAHQHANRWARDIARAHAGRPRPLPTESVR